MGKSGTLRGTKREFTVGGSGREKDKIGELGSVCVAASFGLVPG